MPPRYSGNKPCYCKDTNKPALAGPCFNVFTLLVKMISETDTVPPNGRGESFDIDCRMNVAWWGSLNPYLHSPGEKAYWTHFEANKKPWEEEDILRPWVKTDAFIELFFKNDLSNPYPNDSKFKVELYEYIPETDKYQILGSKDVSVPSHQDAYVTFTFTR